MNSTGNRTGRNINRTLQQNSKKDTSKSDAVRSLEDICDKELREAVREELNRRERRRKFVALLLGTAAVLCIGYFALYYYMNYRTQQKTEGFAKLIHLYEQGAKTPKPRNDADSGPETEYIVLPKYENLVNRNKSLIGWVKIDDTNIDYPVMQTVDNEYYLTHDTEQNKDKNGSIFLDTGCDIMERSTNLIVYGHHMKSGAMFGQLDKYADVNFYLQHPTFEFDTIYETGTYDIAYVFRSQVFKESDIVFKYYQFIDANSETEFDSNMREMENLSLYHTGITPKYGDKLVTLSTCDHSEEANGRFVVVGVKKY